MNEAKITQVMPIDVHELKKRLDQDPNLCIIDVRENDEWDKVHIPSAIHIPKDTLMQEISGQVANKNQPIYLHCQGGTRSSIAGGWLIEAGYTEVYSVAGGIRDWESFGYPLIRSVHGGGCC